MSVVDDEHKKNSVYVRSVATRKTSGSVPLVVQDMAFCLLEVGWDKVVIETVGAGQSEVRCLQLQTESYWLKDLREAMVFKQKKQACSSWLML